MMTENQFEQMMNMMNKSVSTSQATQKIVAKLEKSVNRLEKDVAELKVGQARLESNVSELKEGQLRLEKSFETNNKALYMLAGDNIRIKSRLDLIERVPH
jgi:exonuclease VII small subunit